MAGYEVGTLRAKVVPDATGFHVKLKKELEKNSPNVAIDVAPNLRGFKTKLMEDLKAVTAGVSVKVPVDLDSAGIKAQLETLSRDRRMSIGVDADTRGVEAQLDRAARSRTASVNANADTTAAESRLSLLERARSVEVNVDLDRGLSSISRLSSGVAAGIGSLTRLGAAGGVAALGIGAIVPVAAATAASLTHVASAAGVATASLAPAAIASSAVAFGALKIGLMGVGDALKNLGDTEKFNEALQGMSTNAQAAMLQIQALKPELDSLKNSVQDSLFQGVAQSLQEMTVLLPAVGLAMNTAAAGANSAATGLASFVSQGTGLGMMNSLLGWSGISAGFLFQALGSVTQGIITLGAAGAPVFAMISGGIQQQTADWAANLQKMYETGELQQRLAEAMARLTAAWDVAKSVFASVGGIISGVFRAAGEGSGFALGPLQQMLGYVNQWVNSFQGQTALQDFFRSVGEAVSALAPVLGVVAGIFGTQLAPILSTIVQAIAPYAVEFFQAVSDALTILEPILPTIAENFGLILVAFADLLPTLAQIAVVLLPPLVSLITVLAPVIMPLIPVITALVAAMRVWAIVQGILNVVMMANPIVLIVMGIIAAIGILVVGILYLWNHCEGFRTAMIAIWNAITGYFSFVWELMKSVWAGISDAFRRGVEATINFLVGFKNKFIDAWNAVKNFFSETWDRLKETASNGLSRLMDTVRGIPDKIKSVFNGAKDWLFDSGKDIVTGLINGVKNLAPKIGEWFLDKLPGWIKTPFKKALGIHSPSRVFFEYGGFIGDGLQDGIDAKMPEVQATSKNLAVTADVEAKTNLDTTALTAPPVAAPTLAASTTATPASPDTEGAGGDGIAQAASGVAALGAVMAETKAAVIDPVLSGIQANMAMMGSGVATTAGTIVTPAFGAMATALSAAKTMVIDPTLAGVRTAMTSTGMNFQGTVNGAINPALGAMRASTTLTGQVVSGQAYGVIMPTWSATGSHIRAVQSGPIETAFRETRGSLDYTARSFGPAAGLIAQQWSAVRPATADPVRYAVNQVFNDGLVGMWNSVSDLLGTKKMGAYVAHFATGGYVSGPGGATDDKIPAMLSNGEYVVKADAVRTVGIHNLNALNSGKVAVANTAYKQNLPALMENDATFRAMASRYAAGGIVEGSPAWNQLKRGWDWAKSLSGRPYVLGGDPVGGGGTDCSGYMGSIADRIQGGAGHRSWATMQMNPGNQQLERGLYQGFVKGLSAGFSIGVHNGGAAGGHTAGTIGGVPGMPATNVESGGSPSRVKFGTGAVGADDSYFDTHYHLPIVDGRFVSGGNGSGPSMQELVAQAMAPFKEKVKAAVAGYRGKGGFIDGVPGGVATKLGDAIQTKVGKLAEDFAGGPIPGGSGAERWRPMIKRAYAKQGYQFTQAKEDAWVRQIHSESRGDPNIAQQIVDVNGTGESAGVGLGQMIPTTWAEFRDPTLPDNRRDPWAMINAMVRYGERKFGAGLLNVIGHGHGYDMGGWLDPGQGMTYNGFRKPEAVLTPSESEAFVGIARAFLDGKDGSQYVGQHVENQWVVDTDELAYGTQRAVRRAMREEMIHG